LDIERRRQWDKEGDEAGGGVGFYLLVVVSVRRDLGMQRGLTSSSRK